MAALRNAGGYTVIVPDEAVARYVEAGWVPAGTDVAPAPQKRTRKRRRPRVEQVAPVVPDLAPDIEPDE